MKSVLIGMSGGVDSSVAAAILKEQGYKVIGATMKLWHGNSDSNINDAKAVCDKLGIEFITLDCQEEFKKRVIDYFINEYTHGRTPNPCIVCNKYLKFGAMLDKAIEMGIDYVATGHYARIEKDSNGKYLLRVSDAAKKDQSYFLYNFTQEKLARTLMPLGEYNKEWVREKARELGLNVADKSDSQEICFVEDDDYAKFIREYSGYVPKEGNIFDINGNVIGTHKGLIYYTIGQRKGIGAYGRPMFVMKINAEKNAITLGEKGMEFSNELTASDVNFISGEFPNKSMLVSAKVRYGAKPAECMICPIENGRVKVMFPKPQRAVTPGQAVVFYDGDVVLGGGTVD